MDLVTFIRLAQRYSDLGTAVQDQMRDVCVEGGSHDDQNPNALRLIESLLDRLVVEDVDGAESARDEIRDHLADMAVR